MTYGQPKWDAANPVAPFDAHGNLLEYPSGVEEWRPVQLFDARLRLVDYFKGRSAVRFIWEDESGRRWGMFLSDAFALIQGADYCEGATRVKRWTVVKRGASYGLAPAPEAAS